MMIMMTMMDDDKDRGRLCARERIYTDREQRQKGGDVASAGYRAVRPGRAEDEGRVKGSSLPSFCLMVRVCVVLCCGVGWVGG